MNTTVRSLLLGAAASSILLLTSSSLQARENAPVDPTAQQLVRTGTLPVKSVGPYVEVGTFQIQVAAKLGQPNLRLADGSWLYHRRNVVDSSAEGTVVIRFENKRVAEITLVTPAVATALVRGAAKGDALQVAATR